MVWGLFPTESTPGAKNYYIFSQGSFKVGRKDCDVVVQTDTSISRLHAEIIVAKMVAYDLSNPKPTNASIIDRSKYGTWINKDSGTNAVRVSKDEATELKNGDVVTFGTGSAVFRFRYVPVDIYFHCSKPNHADGAVKATAESIGASATCKWHPECTHVLVEGVSNVTLDLIEAVANKKPVVLSDWLKALADMKIRTEFPCLSSYLPFLNLEGTSVEIVEPKTRERCLEGHTFILGASCHYKFGDKFQFLLEAFGATVLSPDNFFSGSQISSGGNSLVLVISDSGTNIFDHHPQLSSLSRVTDVKLTVAILSGRMEASIIERPRVIVVTSSNSTDETIVADSDVEIDTATSGHHADVVKPDDKSEVMKQVEPKIYDIHRNESVQDVQIHETRGDNYSTSDLPEDKTELSGPKNENIFTIKRSEKNDVSTVDEYQKSDIIYSQDLIVRVIKEPVSARSDSKKIVNFKRFRKTDIVSGNSFKDLVPFSKEPYNESGYGSMESSDFIKEEKKRKQLEAIAEDLFNSEKARKRASAGTSIQAFLSHR